MAPQSGTSEASSEVIKTPDFSLINFQHGTRRRQSSSPGCPVPLTLCSLKNNLLLCDVEDTVADVVRRRLLVSVYETAAPAVHTL